VILLLAIAVILPTVCLLWFMGQAVKNVQLAAQQKLIDVYKEKVEKVALQVDTTWRDRTKLIEKNAKKEPMMNFLSYAITFRSRFSDAFITYDSSGGLMYPIIHVQDEKHEEPEEFELAWKQEFEEKNYEEAIKTYEKIADSTKDDYVWRKAMLGKARCLRSLGKIETALRRPFRAAARDRLSREMSPASASLAAHARIMIADLKRPLDMTSLASLIGDVILYGQGSNHLFLPIDSRTRIFVLQKALKMAEEAQIAPGIKLRIERAKRLLAAEQLAVEFAERYPNTAEFKDWPIGSLHRLDMVSDAYAFYYQAAGRTFLLVKPGEEVRNDFDVFEQFFGGSDVLYRLLDDKGVFVSGIDQSEEKAFLTLAVGSSMPDWKVELYFKDSDIFTKAASRERAVYIWAGILVIVLILAAGGFAGQSVGRQIKLNRLKNDFIATVSHELKTPLASMRVLADTLLEGNYKEQKQATEYLQLICKENKRLSGLIDNFLTFSRMERNKQAFEIVKTSPAVIARAATDAVKTTFNKSRCEFKVEIGDDLPDVLADQDAMVTVLVNLLDNAYKYSYDDKHIELRVFSDNGSVRFCVRDNGIGISRRSVKKIFKRFYQVDRSLSRETEGCGLGLSIAKFIVDAHKGSISIESKPGAGTTFTVKLPAAN
jgi:signal transduction histidine kinase